MTAGVGVRPYTATVSVDTVSIRVVGLVAGACICLALSARSERYRIHREGQNATGSLHELLRPLLPSDYDARGKRLLLWTWLLGVAMLATAISVVIDLDPGFPR
jgi:hypothetical protein